MKLKEELRKLPISIADQLPRGAISQISEEMGLRTHSVTRMLNGEFGYEENLIRMLNIVASIAKNEATKQQNLSDVIASLLEKTAVEVSAG